MAVLAAACVERPAADRIVAEPAAPDPPPAPVASVPPTVSDPCTAARVTSVDAAASADRLLVSTPERQFVTDLDARVLHEVVLPPGADEPMLAPDGAVYAFGDGYVAELAPDGLFTTLPAPPIEALRFAVSAEHVIAWGAGGLAAWPRAGGGWGVRHASDAFEYGYGGDTVVDVGGGRVVLLAVDVNTCGSTDRLEWQHVYAGRPPALRRVAWPDEDMEYAGWWTLGAGGWLYTVERGRVTAHRAARTVRGIAVPHAAPGDGIDGLTRAATNGRVTFAILDASLLRLDGPRATVVAAVPRGDVWMIAVDARARPLAVADGRLLRLEGGAWRVLRDRCEPGP
jgi:hypothetical protein